MGGSTARAPSHPRCTSALGRRAQPASCSSARPSSSSRCSPLDMSRTWALPSSSRITARARAEPVGLLHLPLQRAPGEVELGPQSGAAQLAHERERPGALRGAGRRRTRPPRARARARRAPAGSARSRRPSRSRASPGRPAPRPGRRSDRRRRASRACASRRVGLELEHGPRVVVEAAHEGPVDLVLDARLVEQRGAVRRSARRRRRRARSSIRGASAITAFVSGSLESKARSGFSSIRSRTSPARSPSCPCR